MQPIRFLLAAAPRRILHMPALCAWLSVLEKWPHKFVWSTYTWWLTLQRVKFGG